MGLHEIDDQIDRLSIHKQLQILLKSLREAKNKIELSNLLWERALAAEDMLTVEETKLFDSAADNLLSIQTLVGRRGQK